LGYPLAPYIDGPAQAALDIEEHRGGETVIGGEFDLTPTTLDIPEAHFTKPAGQAAQGRILVRTKTGQPVQFDRIELTGEDLAVNAKAVLPAGGGWAAEIAQFRHAGNDAAGRIVYTASGDAQIELRGRRYDLRPFIDEALGDEASAAPGQASAPAAAPKSRLVLDLRFDEAVIDKDLEMRNLVLSVQREPKRLEHVSLTGGFATT